MARFDLHFHTLPRSHCSHMTLDQGLAAAVEAGLDGLVLTEHNELWPMDELTPFRRKAPKGFKLFVGTEINCAENHYLVYGLSNLRGIYYGIPAADLVTIAHQFGAAVVAAHPYRWEQWQGDYSAQLDIDGIEVDSNNTSAMGKDLAERLAGEKGIHRVVASDAHSTTVVGKYWQDLPDSLESVRDLAGFLRLRPRGN
jgi:predicted metal-dependent phosphoesterase TrpH